MSVGTVEEPHAGPGQVRILVRAAAVTPMDAALRAGRLATSLTWPHVPGVDAAGVVDEVGTGATGVRAGEHVFGTVDLARLGGASAQYAVLQFWGSRPAALTWEEAATLGSSTETTTRVLDLLDVGAGTTLLVDGAAGGVGSIVVQMAIARGASVVGTASADNQDFLRGLGARATTYGPGLPERVATLAPDGVDVALDVAGAGSLPDLVAVTGHVDRVLTIADRTAARYGVRLSHSGSGHPDGRHGLALVADLASTGRLHVPVRAMFSLDRGSAAHELAASGHGRGKVVLRVSEE